MRYREDQGTLKRAFLGVNSAPRAGEEEGAVTAAVSWDDRFATHDMGRGGLYLPVGGLIEDDVFVDNTQRITRTRALFRTAGIDERVALLRPREATREELLRVHSEEHVERMEAVSEAGGGDAGGGYTPMDGRSYGLAVLSAGSALTALEQVLAGDAVVAHAMLRRSGHHAWRDSGYGFCVFNNCAVAAAAARAGGLDRVAIVDVDAHQGNGSEAIFLDDPTVLTVSIQQDRSFPVETGDVSSVGAGDGEGFNVNVNLPAGTGDPGYLDALDRVVLPVLAEHAPQLIVIACGVDGSVFDPMARLSLTAAGYAEIGRRLRAVADEVCGGRIVSVQEGGYSPVYAPFCWLALLEGMAGLDVTEDPWEAFLAGQACCRELAPWQREANSATRRALAQHWSALR
jgi:acetoin utilization deacetylase AcuC-like enzyme